MFMWMAQSFSYYICIFMIRRLEGDFFVNVFIFSGTELFSHAFVGLIINKISLNQSYMIAFLTAFTASMLYSISHNFIPSLVPFLLGVMIFGIIFSTNTNWNSNQ